MSSEVSSEVRAKIVEKLRLGALPRERPRVLKPSNAAQTEPDYWIGSGPAGECAACDEPIKEGEMFEGFRDTTGAVLRLHEGCGRSWEEHVRRA